MDCTDNGTARVDRVPDGAHDDGGCAGVEPRGGFVHEDHRGVCDQLDGDGEPLALLDGEAELAGDAHDGVAQRLQLDQGHHL